MSWLSSAWIARIDASSTVTASAGRDRRARRGLRRDDEVAGLARPVGVLRVRELHVEEAVVRRDEQLDPVLEELAAGDREHVDVDVRDVAPLDRDLDDAELAGEREGVVPEHLLSPASIE